MNANIKKNVKNKYCNLKCVILNLQPGAGDVSRTSLGWNPETRVSGFQGCKNNLFLYKF